MKSKDYVDGCHEGIKLVISKIEDNQKLLELLGYEIEITHQLERLKDDLGILVYKNWPNK